MAGCQNCVSCQGCHRCQGCNSCEDCVSCEVVCNSSQAFCSIGKQSVTSVIGNFSFGQSLATDQLFLSKTNWNKILEFINKAYSTGSQKSYSTSLPTSDSNTFMTADMFNRVASALGELGSSGPSRRVSAVSESSLGSIVYGSYFEELQNYANDLKFKTDQCDLCNINCDSGCDACQGCDSCQGCNSSQNGIIGTTCCSSCHSHTDD